MTQRAKNILGGLSFLAVIIVGTYLLIDLESLTDRELKFIGTLENDVAQALGEKPADFFPKAGRMPQKFQMGGTPPAVYKLKVTTGRRGRRLTFDLSIQRTADKAKRKFETRWTHELRAHRLGKLGVVPLKVLDQANSRLAHILLSDGQMSGFFFLAQRGRGLFGLTFKGIRLDEFKDFERMILPTLKAIEEHGPTLMLDADS